MKSKIELKQAKAIVAGDCILTPQYATGVILADKVIKATKLDKGLKVELATQNRWAHCQRLHVISADDMVVVVC